MVVRGISPVIVRTVEVPAGTSLALLHRVLLVCLGWSGEHLHVFEVRGRRYADCAFVDARSSRGVWLGSLGLRVGERFCWRYDFCSDWVIDVRVEAVVDVDAVRVVSGRRAGPPEWVGGPHGFLGWEDSHSLVDVLDVIARTLEPGPEVDVDVGRLASLRVWLGRDRFDPAEVNVGLSALSERWSKLEVPSCESLSKSVSTTTTTNPAVSAS